MLRPGQRVQRTALPAPEINHFLAAVVDGTGSTLFTKLDEVSFEFTTYFVKLGGDDALDEGAVYSLFAPSSRLPALRRTSDPSAAVPIHQSSREFYQPIEASPMLKSKGDTRRDCCHQRDCGIRHRIVVCRHRLSLCRRARLPPIIASFLRASSV